MNTELATRMALLKALKEQHEAAAKKIGAEMQELGVKIFNQMMDAGEKSTIISGAIFADRKDRRIAPDLKYHGTIVQVPIFYAFLKETQQDSMIKPTVHAKTLESWIKKQKINKATLPPDTILRVWTQETAKVTRVGQSDTEEEG